MVAPQRWLVEPPASEEGAEIARLLREEAERPAPDLGAGAWRRLEPALRRKRRRGRWGVLGVGLPVLAAAAGVVYERSQESTGEPGATRVGATSVRSQAVDATERPGSAPLAAPEAPTTIEPSAPSHPGPSAPAPRSARKSRRSTVAPSGTDLDAVERQAAAAHRAGDGKAAARGYLQLSRTSGLRAENALYKLGLVRLHLEDDVQGALDAWGEFRRRFPQGQLATEVDISVLAALERTGRSAELLREGEAFLRARSGSERAGEVHALLGSLLHRNGDCARALPHLTESAEWALPLARADEISYRRAMCLKALGSRKARAALNEYLARFPSGRFRAAAKRALAE